MYIDKSLPRPAPTAAYSWRNLHPDARLAYIRDHAVANDELARLPHGVYGFDLEWKPTFVAGQPEHPVALVQLASDKVILLIQLSAMKEFPIKLADVLADPAYIKTGVAIQSDAEKIARDCNIPLRSVADLSLLARTADNARWQGKYNSSLGLARLVEAYEYLLLEKSKITRSNWEAILSEAQMEYAANDAHAAWVLYHKLFFMLPNLPKPAEEWYYTFDYHDERFWCADGRPWVAMNPDYDAGPPPPPRPPRVQKERAPREPSGQDGDEEPRQERERPARREVPPVDNFVPYRRGPRGTRIYLIPGQSPPPKPVGPVLPERFRRANVPTYASVSARPAASANANAAVNVNSSQPRNNPRRPRRPNQHGTRTENPGS